MALNESVLSLLMQATFGIFTPGAKDEFECYAEGVVMGLKLGTVTVTTAGAAGSPGQGTFIGALQGGPLVMVPLVAANSIGILPPIPEGAVTPLQVLWYLAISQISTHVLTALQVDSIPADGVATGVGVIAPGGFSIDDQAISNFIVIAYLKKGLTVTPRRKDIADVIGKSTKQMMLLATMIIPIVGGATSSGPSAGSRSGTIS